MPQPPAPPPAAAAQHSLFTPNSNPIDLAVADADLGLAHCPKESSEAFDSRFSSSAHFCLSNRYSSSSDSSSISSSSEPLEPPTAASACAPPRPPIRTHTRSARSVTFAIPTSRGDEDMATAFAPSSPPDLSSSRSSTKSSSSPFANDDYTDPSNFEEISLANDPPPSKPLTNTAVKPRPPVRPPLTTGAASAHAILSSPNGASGAGPVASRVANGSRRFKRPVSPRHQWQRDNSSSAAMTPPSFPSARRTPSPNKSSPLLLSPTSPIRTAPHLRSYDNSPLSPSRRGSWQAAKRKTAAELEQEYHDSDEELPEDAIVWNIPLTPRPQHSRSESNSPERRHSPERRFGKARAAPPKPKPPRSKSWSDAMGDLSDEVKALTAALESHADHFGDKDRPQSSSGAPVRPSLKNHHAKSMNLPVQRGHAMIDPLPVSKEKEKFLTRTRPSWLPPKCPKEEKKHLREWERMMAGYLAAEKRRAATQTKSKASMERHNATVAQLWESQVLCDWDAAMRAPETREMWWRGIPQAVRGKVWTKAIGNDLQLSYASYFAALRRASATEAELSQESKESQPQSNDAASSIDAPIQTEAAKQTARMARSLQALDGDIALAFPSLGLFQPGNPLHKALRNILKAYSAYRSDTGYVRGTSGIAALLLLHLSPKASEADQDAEKTTTEQIEDEAEAKAFIALSNLLNKQPALAFCLSDDNAKQRFALQVRTILNLKLPRLAHHLARQRLGVDDWLTPMVQSMFTSMLGPTEAARVWDVLVFEGDVAFVRVIVGLLACLEGSLYGDATEVASVLSWRGWVARAGEGAGIGTGSAEDAANALIAAIRWAGRKEEMDPRSRESVVSL